MAHLWTDSDKKTPLTLKSGMAIAYEIKSNCLIVWDTNRPGVPVYWFDRDNKFLCSQHTIKNCDQLRELAKVIAQLCGYCIEEIHAHSTLGGKAYVFREHKPGHLYSWMQTEDLE